MLAKRLATILPPLTLEEALETTKIHSIVGLLSPGQALVTRRPFRAPHHTAINAGLLGGKSFVCAAIAGHRTLYVLGLERAFIANKARGATILMHELTIRHAQASLKRQPSTMSR
jgi:hypothetical protein